MQNIRIYVFQLSSTGKEGTPILNHLICEHNMSKKFHATLILIAAQMNLIYVLTLSNHVMSSFLDK